MIVLDLKRPQLLSFCDYQKSPILSKYFQYFLLSTSVLQTLKYCS